MDKKIGGGLGAPSIAQMDTEKGWGEKRSLLETKILHHDLLNRIEALLTNSNLVIDLNSTIQSDETSPEVVRAVIANKPYLRVQGWSVIEDYQRIMTIADRFSELVEFFSQAQIDAIKKSPEYAQLQVTIEGQRKEISQIKDRNLKAQAKTRLGASEKLLEQMLKDKTVQVDPKLINAMKLFITTFMPNRINFRIYPLVSCPSFQVLCNLKRECFVDQDLEHLLYGYGNRPNIQLAAFGLITSLPDKSGQPFDPLSEFSNSPLENKQAQFEKAMRGIFTAMDGFEELVRFSRYPNVTIHPIAVYRNFSGLQKQIEAG